METAFERYVAPARRHPALWRLGLGVALIVAGWIVTIAVLQTLVLTSGALDALRSDEPLGMVVILLSFAGPLTGTLVAAHLLHRRGPVTLLGPPRTAALDFATAVVAVAIAYAPMLALWSLAYDSRPGVPLPTWVLYLVPGLLAVAVQTGAEEVMFRGYLQSQLAARFRSPIVWALLPSLLFGLVHDDPSMAAQDRIVAVGATAVFGLLAADLTARTGTLGASWGLHFANNVFALMLLGYPDTLSGLALRQTPYRFDDPTPPSEVILTMAALLAAWALIRRASRGG